MARFFKILVRVLVLVYAAVILALTVPPLIGYTTAAVLETTEGNQAVGTVAYAKRIPVEELEAGEKILVTGVDTVNVYTVQFVNSDTSTVTVSDSESQEIPVRSYVYRMVLAVPVIGYVIVALQTLRGVIMLALAAALLILLCILTGIWSKSVKEKKRRRREADRYSAETEGGAAGQKTSDRNGENKESAADPPLNARAEAYFAAKRAEEMQPKPVVYEEYEEFPPVKQEDAAENAAAADLNAADQATEYFDDDEEDDEADSWLHDDVDDEELYSELNNRAATESLMATARLFAINRAAQLKEQMAAEDASQTRVVKPEELSAVRTAEIRENKETPSADRKTAESHVKEIAVDKIINLKELKELDEDTQKIVLTINIKVVPE